jgi:uncharacterized protein Usg
MNLCKFGFLKSLQKHMESISASILKINHKLIKNFSPKNVEGRFFINETEGGLNLIVEKDDKDITDCIYSIKLNFPLISYEINLWSEEKDGYLMYINRNKLDSTIYKQEYNVLTSENIHILNKKFKYVVSFDKIDLIDYISKYLYDLEINTLVITNIPSVSRMKVMLNKQFGMLCFYSYGNKLFLTIK